MLLTLDLPPTLASAIGLESAHHGISPAAWVLDRLMDRFGITHRPAASRVPLLTDDTNNDATNDDL